MATPKGQSSFASLILRQSKRKEAMNKSEHHKEDKKKKKAAVQILQDITLYYLSVGHIFQLQYSIPPDGWLEHFFQSTTTL